MNAPPTRLSPIKISVDGAVWMESVVNKRGHNDGLGLPFPYQVTRSARRRTVSIEVRAGQVIVRAPLTAPTAFLVSFLHEKSEWVVRKVAEQKAALALQPRARHYEAGSSIQCMDESLRLVVAKGPRAAIFRIGSDLHVILSSRSRASDQDQIRALLTRWYQQQALQILTEKTAKLCALSNLACALVKVRATRSKWGHCTSKGVIQYNWQILLAPEAVVDYLVAHEVSHLRHHNHSADFWALVAHLCPTYKTDRAWLKSYGAQLVI